MVLVVACGGAASQGAPAKAPDAPAEAPALLERRAPGRCRENRRSPGAERRPERDPEEMRRWTRRRDLRAATRSSSRYLCDGYPKPDVALIMFNKSSPFTRVYLNRNMEGWYTSGQQSTSAKLVFDEEVVVLAHPKPKAGGMVIGNGGTNYDVLRIDGVCSSVEPEAITTRRPPSPKYAVIPWQHLEKNVRDALLADPNIAKADATRRKECKGTTSLGVISPKCAKADDQLSITIADYVAHGGASPMPKH